MNWNKIKDWIAPLTEIEFHNWELQIRNEKITIEENTIVCKKDENGKFKCKTARGETFVVDEQSPSCDDIKNVYYKNRNKNKKEKILFA